VHGDEPHLHEHDHSHAHALSPTAAMILLGDGLHNFVDGVLIAAAFLTDPALGVATALAVVAHEIPQELGDFMVLLAAGYSRGKALLLNAVSGAAAVAGGVLGYFALQGAQHVIPYALALSAASFIYIAVADLVPELHKARKRFSELLLQSTLIGAGILAVAALHRH
jgi:zinc and cadmium transporter